MSNPHIKYLKKEILIEWIYENQRFGISLDFDDPDQSSWFFIVKDDVVDCGLLPKELLVPLG